MARSFPEPQAYTIRLPATLVLGPDRQVVVSSTYDLCVPEDGGWKGGPCFEAKQVGEVVKALVVLAPEQPRHFVVTKAHSQSQKRQLSSRNGPSAAAVSVAPPSPAAASAGTAPRPVHPCANSARFYTGAKLSIHTVVRDLTWFHCFTCTHRHPDGRNCGAACYVGAKYGEPSRLVVRFAGECHHASGSVAGKFEGMVAEAEFYRASLVVSGCNSAEAVYEQLFRDHSDRVQLGNQQLTGPPSEGRELRRRRALRLDFEQQAANQTQLPAAQRPSSQASVGNGKRVAADPPPAVPPAKRAAPVLPVHPQTSSVPVGRRAAADDQHVAEPAAAQQSEQGEEVEQPSIPLIQPSAGAVDTQARVCQSAAGVAAAGRELNPQLVPAVPASALCMSESDSDPSCLGVAGGTNAAMVDVSRLVRTLYPDLDSGESDLQLTGVRAESHWTSFLAASPTALGLAGAAAAATKVVSLEDGASAERLPGQRPPPPAVPPSTGYTGVYDFPF